MKPQKDRITLNSHNTSESAPVVQLYDSILECSFICEGEYQYAISNETGSIILKGEFLNGFRLDINHILVGYYNLVIFNDLKRHVYSFRVK